MQYHRLAALEIHPLNLVELPTKIEGLRVVFSVKKNLKKSTNTADIQVYNLSQATRFQIKDVDVRVLLRAGYAQGDGLMDLFEGDIVGVNHAHQPPDTVTRIEANDGQKVMRETHLRFSYAEDTPVQRILDDILNGIPLPKKVAEGLRAKLQGKRLVQGLSHFGPAREALDTLCQAYGLEFSIQDMRLQVLEKGGTLGVNPSSAVLLSPDSGLIASPERLRQLEDEAKPGKRPPGWRIRCLLQPLIVPGEWVAVQCKEIPRATAFRAEKVEHRGDTHGAEWETAIEVADPGRPL